jgi:hypothetical protein
VQVGIDHDAEHRQPSGTKAKGSYTVAQHAIGESEIPVLLLGENEMTLYEKRGRRYYPAREEIEWDSWPEGYHLVHVRPGWKSIRYNVTPDNPAVLAALKSFEELLVISVQEQLNLRPQDTPVTPKQRAAWSALSAALGKEAVLSRASTNEAVQKAIEEFRKLAFKEEK